MRRMNFVISNLTAVGDANTLQWCRQNAGPKLSNSACRDRYAVRQALTFTSEWPYVETEVLPDFASRSRWANPA